MTSPWFVFLRLFLNPTVHFLLKIERIFNFSYGGGAAILVSNKLSLSYVSNFANCVAVKAFSGTILTSFREFFVICCYIPSNYNAFDSEINSYFLSDPTYNPFVVILILTMCFGVVVSPIQKAGKLKIFFILVPSFLAQILRSVHLI